MSTTTSNRRLLVIGSQCEALGDAARLEFLPQVAEELYAVMIDTIVYRCPPFAEADWPAARTSRLPARTRSVPSKGGQSLVLASGTYFLRTSVCVSSDRPMMTGVRTGLPSTWR